MENSTKLRNLSIAFSAIILGVVLGFGIFTYVDNNDNDSDEVSEESQTQKATLEVIDANNNSTNYKLEFKEGETAFEAMQGLQYQDESFNFEYGTFEGLGAFVTSINGITADPNSEFISFQVNGQDSMEGISSYIVKKDDKLTFKVVKFN